MLRVPYTLVVGEKEAESEAVAPKANDGTDLGAMPVAQFLERLLGESRPPAFR
jgi:threonyl-tRNA synthetase